MAKEMSDDERRAFLGEGTRTGKLAVVRKDGTPHVVPIWFVLDGDDVLFNCAGESVKARVLRRTGRAAICVDDQQPPYSFVSLEGPVEISEDPDDLLRFATQIGGRYMGEDRAEEFGRRNGVPGELLVRIHPERVVAQAAVAD